MTAAGRRCARHGAPLVVSSALLAATLSGCGGGTGAGPATPPTRSPGTGTRAPTSPTPDPALPTVLSRPHLVFRTTDINHQYGVVAAAPLDRPDGPRAYTGYDCDRVYASRNVTVCLTQVNGTSTTYSEQVRGADGRLRHTWALPGAPSRARISPDGRLVASTVFVSGHSYENRTLSTVTEIRRVANGHSYGNLERFALVIGGRRVRPEDRNVWGVTFARDDRTFYATVSTGGHTWLVRGDLRRRTLTSVHENAECPSLSPDGTRVAYKKRVSQGSQPWVVGVLDLASGRETVLPATRGLDDQVEWRDDRHLLYGLPRADQPGTSDVWMVATEPGAQPTLLVHEAWSPAVVR